MKSTLLIICFVFVSLIGAFAQSSFYDLLELRPTISNYNGSVVGGSTILVYGDAGTITRSSNGGQSWEKILLGDSLNIIGIVKSGDKFIGLCSKRFGITSQDGGINWSFTDLGEATEYYKIQNINGKIYVLMNGKFVVMSENFSILKQYEFPTDSLYNDFATSDKWALCSAGPGKLASINLENDELNIIDLKGNEICSDCHVPKLLTPYDDGRVVFSLNGDLYDYDFKYTIIQPTVQLQKINGGALTSRDNDLYFIHSRNFPWVLDSLYFAKIKRTDNSYNRISLAKNDRYILNLSFKSLQFVSNDTLIAVGKYSLICMSYNGGVEWEIKSDISGVSWISLIDENTIKAFGPYGKFFHSDDGGATWLPQKNYIQSVAEEEKFFNPLNGGSFGFKDNLNGYIYVEPFMSKEVNAVITTDGGNTAQPKLIKNLDVSFFRTFSIPYNDNYVFCSSGSYQLGWWAVVFQLDDTLGIQQKTALPHRQFFYLTQFEGNIYALGKDSADAEDIYSIYKSTNGGKDWDKDFSFETVKPIYLAPMEIILINDDIYANWHSSAPKGEDSVLIQNYFKISLSQKSAKKILELEAAGLHKTFFVRDNWYIPYYDIDDKGIIHRGMKKSIDINASEIVWEESINKRYTSPIRQSSLLDSIMVIATYDSLFKSNQIFLAKPKGNTGIADRPRRERVKEIALSGPLASSPAGEYQFNVALDEKNVAEKLTLSAYDVRGSRVDSDFLFTPSEGNRGRLLWKPGKLPPGAYVLILKCGSAVGSATVVVE